MSGGSGRARLGRRKANLVDGHWRAYVLTEDACQTIGKRRRTVERAQRVWLRALDEVLRVNHRSAFDLAVLVEDLHAVAPWRRQLARQPAHVQGNDVVGL